jgi:WD40 repeat protein
MRLRTVISDHALARLPGAPGVVARLRRPAGIPGRLLAMALLGGLWIAPGPGHSEPVLQMQVGYRPLGTVIVVPSPDGMLVAAADHTGVIKVMETRAGRLICTLQPPRGGLPAGGGSRRFTWSTDGRELLSPGSGDRLLVWDLRRCGTSRGIGMDGKGEPPRKQDADAGSRDYLYSVNTLADDRVLIHSKKGLAVLKPFKGSAGREPEGGNATPVSTNAAIDERLREGHIQVLSVSANGRVAVLGDKCAPEFLLDLATGGVRPVQMPGMTPPPGLDSIVGATVSQNCPIFALSADAALMAIKYRFEGKIAVINPLKGEVLASTALENPIDPTFSSRVGPWVKAMAIDRESRQAGVLGLSFSPDGSQLRVLRELHWPLAEGALEVRSAKTLKLESTQALPPQGGPGSRYIGSILALGRDAQAAMLMPRMSPSGFELVVARGSGNGASVDVWPLDAATTAHSLAMTENDVFVQRARMKPFDMKAMANPAMSRADAVAASSGYNKAPFEFELERWSLKSAAVERSKAFPSALPARPSSLAYSMDGRYAAVISSEMTTVAPAPGQTIKRKSESAIALIDLQSSRPRWTKTFDKYTDVNGPSAVAVAPEGSAVAVLAPTSDRKRQLTVLDGQSGAVTAQLELEPQPDTSDTSLHFTRSGAGILVAGFYRWTLVSRDTSGRLTLQQEIDKFGMNAWGVAQTSGRVIAPALPADVDRERDAAYYGLNVPALRLPLPRSPGVAVANAKESRVAAALDDRIVRVFDVQAESPKLLGEIKAFDAEIVQMVFSTSGDRLAIADANGVVALLNTETMRIEARLYAFPSGNWAVVDADGRFDTNDIEGLQRLHWVVPDEPFKALPLEIFMREYFTPGLLARVLSGERLPPVKVLSALNRAQPLVRINGATPSRADPLKVDVTVDVEASRDATGRFGGVSSLQLFRDGSLVGRAEPVINEKANRASVVFKDIRLPRGAASVSFSAYAFNADLVKSETVSAVYAKPAGAATSGGKPGKAYVIGIGVNTSDNPRFNLRYAADDARLSIDALSKRLRAQGQYADVVTVPLIADGAKERNATRARIRSVLNVLGGNEAARAGLADLPEASRLSAATPDDLVIVTFAGHGALNDRGVFHLLPQDVGAKGTRELTPAMLTAMLASSAISTDDLVAWIRDVDAGEFALIIDACHSAASVDAQGFRPGPLGTRGLGQLAYDKGIRILAASQADDVAAEDPGLKHGLLTFALMQDGLTSGRADFKPVDKIISLEELLAYGEVGVPALDEELRSGQRADSDGLRTADEVGLAMSDRHVQRPRLFNFSRRGTGAVLRAVP